jgi:dethiobiotin synthetase
MGAAYFVTGTDTDIGKTFATRAFLALARRAGLRAVGYKPIASGAKELPTGRENEDAVRLLRASSPGFLLAEINPICLLAPIAPQVAARDEGVVLRMDVLRHGLEGLRACSDVVFVEGVGGFRVPLGELGDSAELAVAFALPIILVVGMRLGCVNHALLTAEAVVARRLPFAGWVANTLTEPMPRMGDSLSILEEMLPAPCLGVIPRYETDDAAEALTALRLPEGAYE